MFAMTEQIAAGIRKQPLYGQAPGYGENPLESASLRRELRLLLAAKTLAETSRIRQKRWERAIPCGRQRSTRLVSPWISFIKVRCGGGADQEMKLGASVKPMLRDLVIRLTLLPHEG